MTMQLRFAVFFGLVLVIATGVHFYLWRRLVQDTLLPMPWRRVATVAVITLLIALISSFFLRRLVPLAATRWLLMPVFMWMGMMLLLVTGLISGDAIKLAMRLGSLLTGSDAPADPARRLLFSRMIGGGVAVATVGLTTFASRSALAVSRVVTRRISVTLRRLPAQLDGFRIVQITDLHLGWSLGRTWAEGIVARVNALEPDLVAITGDLVDGSVTELRGDVAPLAQLRARHGVYFCTGNHEYYSGAVAWCAELQRIGIRVLRNERVSIGDGAHGFDLAGIDDFGAEGLAPGHGPDLPRACADHDPARELVLLAHQPRAVLEAATLGVGLQLSGHTHGGQIWPMNFLVLLQQPYISGLVNHEGTQLYISQGTGFWGPPMRLGTAAEITEIRLRSPAAQA